MMSTTTSTGTVREASASDIHLVRQYPHPPEKVWRALTDPVLIELWALPTEGFSTAIGARFKFVGKPQIGWGGIVDCEVLESREPSLLRYTWLADEGDLLLCTYILEPHDGGTRFTFEQTGFKGMGGYLLSKLVMTPVRKKMFGVKIPAILADVDDDGNLRAGSLLKPKV